MTCNHLLAAVLVLSTSLLAGCTSPEPAILTDGFEDGLDAWTTASDLPEDPNRPGEQVAWNISLTTDRAHGGEHSVNLSIDGRQDDGTIWITRTLHAQRGLAYDVTFSIEAFSRSESFNTLAHLVAYLGTAAPTAEESFPSPGEHEAGDEGVDARGLREPLNQAQGWRTYTFGWTTPELTSDTLHVAVGISAVWETEMFYHVDDLSLVLEPAGGGGASY